VWGNEGLLREEMARVLDVVIREFNNGAESEAIVHGCATLNLADVYGVIAYYLRHRQEIDHYLEARR
jgi:uncharacterized protein (DUF433 family)